MSTLRAKMQVYQVLNTIDQNNKIESQQIRLQAVYSDNPNSENHQWSTWTPSGCLELTITNPSAFNKVTRGQEFYLDLIVVEKD
jgi:hypothetical protein